MRWRRWILRGLLGVFALAVLLVVVLLLALAHLDSAPMKGLALGQAQKYGVTLDYQQAAVTLGGVHVRNLVVRAPGVEAPLVTVGAIDGDWSPFHERVDDLTVADVVVTVVENADGTTSLDRFLAALPPSAAKPKTPLSRLLEGVLPDGVAANVKLAKVTVVWVPVTGPPARLEGVAAAAVLAGGKLDVTLGPSDLVATIGDRKASAHLQGKVAVAPPRVTASLALDLGKQDLAPELPPVKKLFALDVTADFVPGDKVHVEVGRLVVADDAAALTASADLVDTAGGGFAPKSVGASGTADLRALVKMLPAAYGPVELEAAAPVTVKATNLTLTPPGGTLELEGRIERLAWRDISVVGLDLGLGAESPGVVRGLVKVESVDAAAAHVGRAAFVVEGASRDGKVVDARIFGDIESVNGPAAVENLHVDVAVRHFVVAQETGDVTVGLRAGRVVQGTTRAEGVTVTASAELGAAKTAKAKAVVDVARLEAGGMKPGPAHVELDAPRVDGVARAGEATFLVRYAGAEVAGHVSGSADAPSWDVTGTADAVGPARALRFASKGSAGAVIAADTTVEVGPTQLASGSLRGAKLHVVSTGTRQSQKATIDAALDGVTVGGTAAGSPNLHLEASGDLGTRRLDLILTGKKPDATIHVTGDLSDGKTLRWEASGKLSGLGAYAALLPPGPDYDRLAVELRGSGAVSGVVAVESGGLVLAKDPASSARGKQNLSIGVSSIHVALAESRSADLDAVTVNAAVDLGPTRSGAVDVVIPSLAVAASGVHASAEGVSAHLEGSVDAHGAGSASLRVRAKSLRQSAFASYPVRDLELVAAVTGDPRAVLSMTGSLTNGGAGTSLTVEGALDRRTTPGGDAVPGRRSFWLSGTATQVLDALTGAPDLLRARGKVAVPFRVESGDLALFLASARVELVDVAVALPAREISITGMNGHIPITEEVLVGGPAGATLVGRGEKGLYRQLRFADHQPFLGTADYLTITEVAVGDKKLGPLAGNARVDRDVVAIDQLELEAAGGKITGQCLVQLAGVDTSVAFRGKVTGLRPTQGDDRLDANAALTLTPYRMGLEGRIDIVTIAKSHLRELLDLYDPYHADVASNRVRLALLVGYPEQVRLGFLHGFASLGVSLGGLAGAVSVGDIQGVPIGPALAKYLAPLLERLETK